MSEQTVTQNIAKESLNKTLDEVLELLEADDGKSFEEKKDAAISLLRKETNPELANTLVALAGSDTEGANIKDIFWNCGNIFCDNGRIVLRKPEEPDYEDYISIQKAYNPMRGMLKEKSFCDMI